MKLKWLGHSAFELTSNRGLNILIDPFIQANPVCPLKISDLHPDIICITHGHADHFGDVIEISRNNTNLIVITNYEISIYLQRKDLMPCSLLPIFTRIHIYIYNRLILQIRIMVVF